MPVPSAGPRTTPELWPFCREHSSVKDTLLTTTESETVPPSAENTQSSIKDTSLTTDVGENIALDALLAAQNSYLCLLEFIQVHLTNFRALLTYNTLSDVLCACCRFEARHFYLWCVMTFISRSIILHHITSLCLSWPWYDLFMIKWLSILHLDSLSRRRHSVSDVAKISWHPDISDRSTNIQI